MGKWRIFFTKWLAEFSWSHRLFFGLQLVVALAILFFWYHLPLPGWAVAILAGVAAAMSVHGEMRSWQKALWMILIGFLLVIELRSISADRAESTKNALADRNAQDLAFKGVRDAQDKDFEKTAKSLTDAYDLSRSQFEATVRANQNLLGRTEQAADAAKEGVANLTGADAYVIVFPSFYFDGRQDSENIIRLMVMANGNRAVWDAQVNVVQETPTNDSRMPYNEKFLADINLGAVSSTYARPLGFDVKPSLDEETIYGFSVFARNTPTQEALHIRFNHIENRWQFKTVITRTSLTSRTGHEILQDTGWKD